MTQPTHGIVDAHIHRVASVERSTHPMHTHSHRITFSCRLSFDLRGERQALVQDHRRAQDEVRRYGTKKHVDLAAELASRLEALDLDHDLHAVAEAHAAEAHHLGATEPDHPEIASTRKAADSAGLALVEIHGRYYPLRDKYVAAVREHDEVALLISTALKMSQSDNLLTATLGASVLDTLYARHKSATLGILAVEGDWEKVRLEEEVAVIAHGTATAAHHEARTKHQRERRWIVSATDVTTCPGCLAAPPPVVEEPVDQEVV